MKPAQAGSHHASINRAACRLRPQPSRQFGPAHRKIETDPAHPEAIRDVRGIGYMFVPPKD